jgi:uncharacterized protein (TIGR03790 family)
MILRIFLLACLCLPSFALPDPLNPAQVVVVYNSNIKESRDLAEFYAVARRIPLNQVVGLDVTEKPTIDRATYEKSIRKPLVEKFIAENWWEMGKDANGTTQPVDTRIRCIALMKGIPLRISNAPMPKGETKETRQMNAENRSAVDSELTLMGVADYPIGGFIPNPYFGKDFPAAANPAKFFVMVGRIDAPTYDHCTRMIIDVGEVEKEGLWGRTYLDVAKKGGNFKIGDEWIDNIAKSSIAAGIPTITDRMSNTFVTNYPMTDAAIYFGWYTQHRNGPFLNDQMKFQKGAIAVHLHSFSAQQLLNPAKNWSAALIDRGAAATLGNTWEPYLGATHHFDIFYIRLAQGYTLIEAAFMSINVLSWQNIVIGDPLYQPFKVTSVSKESMSSDREYKLIRLAQIKYRDPEERHQELLKAAENMKSGTVYEMAGFRSLELNKHDEAIKFFTRARELFKKPADQLRQYLNLVELERRRKNNAAAIQILKEAKSRFKKLPETKAIDGLLTILDPPAPPATQRSKK